MSVFIDVSSSIKLALKARYLWISFCIFLVMLAAAGLSAHFGGRQSSVVALDVSFSIVRLMLPLLVVLLVQELISREFDKRYYMSSLSYPRGRVRMLLGRFISVLLLIVALLVFLGVMQCFIVFFVEYFYPQPALVSFGWFNLIVLCFFVFDLLVVMAMATFLSVVASTSSFVLIGTFGFMLVARSYGAIVELLSNNAGVVINAEGYRASLGVLGYLLPDLGALDLRMLALYGKPEFLPADWPWLLLSNLAYACALLALAVWALQRKRFA